MTKGEICPNCGQKIKETVQFNVSIRMVVHSLNFCNEECAVCYLKSPEFKEYLRERDQALERKTIAPHIPSIDA